MWWCSKSVHLHYDSSYDNIRLLNYDCVWSRKKSAHSPSTIYHQRKSHRNLSVSRDHHLHGKMGTLGYPAVCTYTPQRIIVGASGALWSIVPLFWNSKAKREEMKSSSDGPHRDLLGHRTAPKALFHTWECTVRIERDRQRNRRRPSSVKPKGIRCVFVVLVQSWGFMSVRVFLFRSAVFASEVLLSVLRVSLTQRLSLIHKREAWLV